MTRLIIIRLYRISLKQSQTARAAQRPACSGGAPAKLSRGDTSFGGTIAREKASSGIKTPKFKKKRSLQLLACLLPRRQKPSEGEGNLPL